MTTHLPANLAQQWRHAITNKDTQKILDLVPNVPRCSPEEREYAQKCLYIKRSIEGRNICKVANYPTHQWDWNEVYIKFPWYFPEELISLSPNNDRLWSLWASGHQWVRTSGNYHGFLWAVGPAAAGGEWLDWWERPEQQRFWV